MGYPNGVAGEQIPIYGQIVSIADVFDALVSKRCYKEAFELDSAIEEIRASRNIMFGPHVVDAFVKGIEEIIDVMRISQQTGARGTNLVNGDVIEAPLSQ